MEKMSNSREESIQKRKKDSMEHKQRTLEMYDQMAKSSPAGAQKVMNINVLRGSVNNQSCDSIMSDTMSACSSISECGLVSTAPQRDLVEEAIQSRIKAADTEKQRIMAAYDAAQKGGPAGTYRVADLRGFKKEDSVNFVAPKATGACTFGSSGGIPIVPKSKCCAAKLQIANVYLISCVFYNCLVMMMFSETLSPSYKHAHHLHNQQMLLQDLCHPHHLPVLQPQSYSNSEPRIKRLSENDRKKCKTTNKESWLLMMLLRDQVKDQRK